jgi:Astacin (Peptidase family M12A)
MKSRMVRGGWPLLLLLILAVWLVMPTPVWPAAFWFHGVRSRDITVCFAGNAVTARPDRVREIVGHLQRFQYAANIKFKALSGKALDEEAGPGGNLNALGCPAPTQQPNGDDYYAGDVRVALWSTNVSTNPPGKVPGVGCTQDKVASSWSNPPDELELKRACQYNLVLGDDADNTGTPYLNHTLHEFGHALGLVHEHARTDENAQCVPASSGEYHTASSGFITPYDKNSVMHYWWSAATIPNCQHTGTNYSQAGLTGYDKLAVHIMYPEDVRTVEFYGDTVIRTGETLQLVSAWQTQGANMGFVASNWQWWVDGVLRSTSSSLSLAGLGAGAHTLSASHDDFLGRHYTFNGMVRVLSPGTYNQLVSATNAAQLVLVPEITFINMPLLVR